MFQIKSDSKGSYFYRKLKPEISFSDMLDTLNYFKDCSNLPSNLRILEDSRDVKVAFSIKEIPDIMKDAIEIMKSYDLVKHAIVYNSALYTAYGLLAEKFVSNERYFLKVFSSMEAAKDWLEIDDSL